MMNVIIVGGGKTGVYVANLLLANHCRVKVMESRGSVLTKLKDELPSDCIFEGSGTDPNMIANHALSQLSYDPICVVILAYSIQK